MEKNQTSTQEDQLVTMHKKARIRKKRKLMITLVVILVSVLVVVTAAVVLLRNRVRSQFASADASEVQSAEVSIGSIKTTVSGSGTLSAEDVEEIELINTVEIIDYYVEAGDHVEAGDLIATVTNSSLMTAMADKQEELDTLDEEIEEAAGDEVSSAITAGADGRVKAIFAEADEDVATVMYENGSLILLSLDGYMVTEVSSDSLTAGDSVMVTLSDGDSIDGTVEKQVNGVATILVTDNGTTYGDTVTVSDANGNELGTGTLSIHSQMAVMGYAGTVSAVKVSENESVSSGETLLTLTDTETSANYDTLLKERAELEEELNNLIKVYKEGGICAPVSGTVDSLDSSDTDSSSMYTAQGTDSASSITVASISPDTTMAITISVDETDILSLSVGQEATVTIDSIGEDSFTGTVTEVNTTATSSSGVTAYSAVVSIDKTDAMLSGMSASVVITIEGSDNTMLIPIDALHQTSSSAYVYTEYDETTGEFSGMQEVTIGLSNSSYVEIKEGLSEGDTVYYTTSEEDSMFGSGMMDFGNMGGGEMSGFDNMQGGGMSGGGMSGGGMSGGDMPSMPSGGNMPGGGGSQ